jgi:hypothetical protein
MGPIVFAYSASAFKDAEALLPAVKSIASLYASLKDNLTCNERSCMGVLSPAAACLGVRGMTERSKISDAAPVCLYHPPPVPIHWTSASPSPSPSPSSPPGPVTYQNSTPFQGTFQSHGCTWRGSGTLTTSLTLDGTLTTVTAGSIAANLTASGTPTSNYTVCNSIDDSCTAALQSGTVASGQISATFQTCAGASLSLKGSVAPGAIGATTTIAAKGFNVAMGQNMLPASPPPSPSPSPSATPGSITYKSTQTFAGTIANRSCSYTGNITLTSSVITNSTQTAVLGGSIVGDLTASGTALYSHADCSPLSITCTAEIQAASVGGGKIDANFQSCMSTGISLSGTIAADAIDATVTGTTAQWSWSIGQVMQAESASASRR